MFDRLVEALRKIRDNKQIQSVAKAAVNVYQAPEKVGTAIASSPEVKKFVSSAYKAYSQAPKQLGTAVGTAVMAPIEQRRLNQDAETDQRVQEVLRKQRERAMKAGDINRARDLSAKSAQYGERTASNYENFGKNIDQQRGNAVAGTAGTVLQLLGANKLKAMQAAKAAVLPTAFGAGFAKLTGGDVAEGAGQGFGSSLQLEGINKVSKPILEGAQIGRLKYKGITPAIDKLSLLKRAMARAGASGLINVGENELQTRVNEQRGQTPKEIALAAGMGIVTGAGQELLPAGIQKSKLMRSEIVSNQRDRIAELATEAHNLALSENGKQPQIGPRKLYGHKIVNFTDAAGGGTIPVSDKIPQWQVGDMETGGKVQFVDTPTLLAMKDWKLSGFEPANDAAKQIVRRVEQGGFIKPDEFLPGNSRQERSTGNLPENSRSISTRKTPQEISNISPTKEGELPSEVSIAKNADAIPDERLRQGISLDTQPKKPVPGQPLPINSEGMAQPSPDITAGGEISNLPSTDIIPGSVKPKTELLNKAQALRERANPVLAESSARAEAAKAERGLYNPESLKNVARLKQVANSRAVANGDLETLRTKNPKLAMDVANSVMEAHPEITTEDEALQHALDNIPTAGETRVQTPDEIAKAREIEQKAKTQRDLVYNSETDPNLPKEIPSQDTSNIDYKEWQKAVFSQEAPRNIRAAVDDLSKAMESSTDKNIQKKFVTTPEGKVVTSKGGEGMAREVLANSAQWKDKAKISLVRETMDRNFEDIMGKDAPRMKQQFLDPVKASEAERVRFLNTERAQIKDLGIKAGSNDSSLLQAFGEKKISAEQLRKESPNADKIIEAEGVLRQKYDQYLTDINKVLVKNGYDPIPKRKDYFLHFQEINNVLEQVGIPLKDESLPTDINGLTADFKPGKNFFTSALPRLGDKSKLDAIQGIDRYLEGASKQIYHTDNIQNLRLLEKSLRAAYSGSSHLTNFVSELGEYTNLLAGKKSMIDRAAEAMVGRRIYQGAQFIKKQTGANMVGANVSSALTNFIPLTQSMATTSKPAFVKGMLESIGNVFKDDGFVDQSDFLTRRVGSDKLAMTNWEKIGDKTGWLFKTIDNFVSQTVVRAKYDEAIAKGLSPAQAMKKADDWGAKVLADRSLGAMPTLFQSKTAGFLTQFQLEVNNQMSFMAKDIPREFNKAGAASALGQLFLYGYIFNNLFQQATGRRPAFDPIGVLQQAYEDYTNKDIKKGQASGNLVRNIADQLPFAQLITEGGRIPVGSAIPNPIAIASGESTGKKEAAKLLYLLPPTGGAQIKKTIEGVGAFNKGVSQTDAGQVRYGVPQTLPSRLRTAMFGQYSTPEARDYFREGKTPLGDKQSSFVNSFEPKEKLQVVQAFRSQTERDAATKRVKDQLEVGDFNFKDAAPSAVAEATYSKIAALPAKERLQTYRNLKQYLSPEALKEFGAIAALAKDGLSKENRELLLVPEQIRSRFAVEQILQLDKKNRLDRYKIMVKHGIITDDMKPVITKLLKGAK